MRLCLYNAVFTVSEMALDMVVEKAFTSKETKPGLLIVGSSTAGSVAVSSDVCTHLEHV